MTPPLLQYLESLGYKIFTNQLYDLNIVGIRNRRGKPDVFDDTMAVVYKDHQGWVQRMWPITTDPGLYYLMNEDKQLNPAGTAILKEGQYRSTYQIGPHGSAGYEALVQTGNTVTVWRDNDHDHELDYKVNPETGWFGINIHAASSSPYSGDSTTSKVGAWSGGCQVFQNESDFREFMAICKHQIEHHPTWTKFTYTLVKSPKYR